MVDGRQQIGRSHGAPKMFDVRRSQVRETHTTDYSVQVRLVGPISTQSAKGHVTLRLFVSDPVGQPLANCYSVRAGGRLATIALGLQKFHLLGHQ